MDFALTDEQRLVQEQARALLARHFPPAVARAQRAAGGACPAELWRVLAEAGWPGYGLPRAHGGLGADLVDLALLFEECGRALVPARLRATVSAGLLLAAAGRTAELPALARGTRAGGSAARSASWSRGRRRTSSSWRRAAPRALPSRSCRARPRFRSSPCPAGRASRSRQCALRRRPGRCSPRAPRPSASSRQRSHASGCCSPPSSWVALRTSSSSPSST